MVQSAYKPGHVQTNEKKKQSVSLHVSLKSGNRFGDGLWSQVTCNLRKVRECLQSSENCHVIMSCSASLHSYAKTCYKAPVMYPPTRAYQYAAPNTTPLRARYPASPASLVMEDDSDTPELQPPPVDLVNATRVGPCERLIKLMVVAKLTYSSQVSNFTSFKMLG